MAFVMRYRVFSHATGEFLAEGTIHECAEKLGIADNTLRNRLHSQGDRRKYDIVALEAVSSEVAEAIRKWDAFTEPLRKKYGIKAWNGEEDEAIGRNDSG